MNARERFLKIMNFQRADELPILLVESIEGPTMRRWQREGLPEGMHPSKLLGYQHLDMVRVDQHPVPRFDVQVLEETDEYLIKINEWGIKTQYNKKDPDYLWGFLEHPVKNRQDWETMCERYNPSSPCRLPQGWGPDLIRSYNEADHPIGILIYPFFFRHAFYLMGMQNFMLALHDDPQFMHDMFEHNAQFCLRAVKPVLDTVKIDYAVIAEDMAYRGGTHISPQMYREFWCPHQKQVMDCLKEKKIPLVALWNSGNPKPLLPLMIEQGYNMLFPTESQAGLHVVEMMKEYGHVLRYIGNISIQALIRGKEAIRHEMVSKVLPLLDTGGYIPAPDDLIPPEVSFDNFCYYIELLKRVNAGEKV